MEGLEKEVFSGEKPTKSQVILEKISEQANRLVWAGSGALLTFFVNLGIFSYFGNHLDLINKLNIPIENDMKYLAAFSLAEFLVVKRIGYKIFNRPLRNIDDINKVMERAMQPYTKLTTIYKE